MDIVQKPHIKPQVVKRQLQKKESRFVGTGRPKRGQKLYEWHNGQVKEVTEFDQVHEYGTGKTSKRLTMTKGAYYRFAINRKNAIRKFNKIGLPTITTMNPNQAHHPMIATRYYKHIEPDGTEAYYQQRGNTTHYLAALHRGTQIFDSQPKKIDALPEDAFIIPYELSVFERTNARYGLWHIPPDLQACTFAPSVIHQLFTSPEALTANCYIYLYIQGCKACEYVKPTMVRLAQLYNDIPSRDFKLIAQPAYKEILNLVNLPWIEQNLTGYPSLLHWHKGKVHKVPYDQFNDMTKHFNDLSARLADDYSYPKS